MTEELPPELSKFAQEAEKLFQEEQKEVKKRVAKKGDERKAYGSTKKEELNRVVLKRIENELKQLYELAASPVEEALILQLYGDIKLLIENNDIVSTKKTKK